MMASMERIAYNQKVLPNFISKYVKKGNVVVDIGKPNDGWGYRKLFNEMDYKTLDIKKELGPDIVDDIANTKLGECSVDCVICMGIWEQCENPFDVIKGVRKILKVGGYALFGIISVSFPMWQDIDYLRFTPQGARMMLKDFKFLEEQLVFRGELPSYSFIIVSKKEDGNE